MEEKTRKQEIEARKLEIREQVENSENLEEVEKKKKELLEKLG